MREYKYYAFISYKREDEEWAKWLQNKLEYFKLPLSSNKEEYIRPVFRDITDLRPGCLPELIREALDQSKYLIAICSPKYSKSKWCDAEIRHFKETGRIKNVIPFIIDGKPYSENDECFPPTLSELRGTKDELLGADVRTLSNEYALVQIVATMFGVEVDSIWKRYLKDEEERKIRLKEQNDYLLSLQSRITAAKAKELITSWPYDEKTAGRLMLEILPHNMEMPERPWVREAEEVLRLTLHERLKICDTVLPQKTFPISYTRSLIASVKPSKETVMDEETHQLITRCLIPEYSMELYQRNEESPTFLYGLPYDQYGSIDKAELSDNSESLAFLSGEQLKVLTIDSGVVKEFPKRILSEPHKETLKWSPDCRWLSCDYQTFIELYDLKNNKKLALSGHSKKLISISFAKSGRFLVSVGFDRLIIIWDLLDNGRECYRYESPYFASYARFDDNTHELLLALETDSNRQGLPHDKISDQIRNILRRINISTNSEKDLILRDSSGRFIANFEIFKDLGMLIVEELSAVRIYDINTGIKLDEYADAHKLKVFLESHIISFVRQNKIESYRIPSCQELLSIGHQEFSAIELGDDVKYNYFVK